MAPNIVVVVIFTGFLFVDEPSRAHLLTSLLPRPDDTPFITYSLIALDLTIQVFGFVIITFTMVTHLLTFGTINTTLEAELNHMESEVLVSFAGWSAIYQEK